MKKIIIAFLMSILCLSAMSCTLKLPVIKDILNDGNNNDTEVVYANVELYSYTYSQKAKAKSYLSTSLLDLSANNDFGFSYDHLVKDDVFTIDIRLIDTDDMIDFIFLVQINNVKYRYADGIISKITRDIKNKTVDFSIDIVYDGITTQYEIEKIVILSGLNTQYYAKIHEDCKPVVLPTQTGNGTKENPYLVYNAKMLTELMKFPSGTYFMQANDIDLSTLNIGDKQQGYEQTLLDNWKIIGTKDNPFMSFYDGHNFKITRLSIQRFDSLYQHEGVGLFGTIVNGSISNVVLEDYRVEVRYARTIGALVGFAEKSDISNCRLIQGKKANFESGSWSFSPMGGLVGFGKSSSITECHVNSDLGLYCNVDSTAPRSGILGGVIGELLLSQLINCTFDGNLECSSVVGGIVGRSDESIIIGCENRGKVMTGLYGGGLVGQMWRSTLAFSNNSGIVTTVVRNDMPRFEYTFLGGLVGEAGLNYSAYADTGINMNKVTSVILSCDFSGEVNSRLAKTVGGGIACNLYDCIISNITVGGKINSDRSSAIVVNNKNGEKQISEVIITTILDGLYNTIVPDITVRQIFFDSSKTKVNSQICAGLIDKNLTTLTREDLLTFDTKLWNKTSDEIPTLKYTCQINEQMAKDLMHQY